MIKFSRAASNDAHAAGRAKGNSLEPDPFICTGVELLNKSTFFYLWGEDPMIFLHLNCLQFNAMKEPSIPYKKEAASTPSLSKANPGRRILVVDDEPEIRRLNGKVLSRSGYCVDFAEDGITAWNTLQRSRYDLLITDNHMPRLTGVGLIRKLHEACRALPVILASGTVPMEELRRHPDLPINVVLLKPFTCIELLEAVEKALFTDDSDSRRDAKDGRHG